MKTKYKNNDHLPRYYNGDTRYEKVKEQMDLLGITDVTTNRQHKNGTVVWQLPIKNNHFPTSYIEVASFSTGYVRNQNSGYSNYQLNKRCESNPQYYPETKYNVDTNEHTKTGKYLKFTTRGCKLIPIEIDRLEYLITYCLKNYYIKNANQVTETYDCGHYDRIRDLENAVGVYEDRQAEDHGKIKDLENKLATINRISE